MNAALLFAPLFAPSFFLGAEIGPRVGVLVSESMPDRRSMESEVVRELALSLARLPLKASGTSSVAPTFLRVVDDRLVDPAGREVLADGFDVLWCHQGEPGPSPFSAGAIALLCRHVYRGGGLLLSGSAATLLEALGIDSVETETLTFGNDRDQAGYVPVVPEHPVFRGLDLDRGVAWFSNAVFPAFASFGAGGASTRGRILARTPGGAPNPLLEYGVGKGRVIALGWRLSPHFASAPAGYRRNFACLVANLLAALALPDESAVEGIAEAKGDDPLKSLELAIADLGETFGSRYPRGSEYLDRLAVLRKARAAGGEIDAALEALCVEALAANPLLDFDRMLFVRRRADKLGLPMNYYGNSSVEPVGYENEIAVLSPVRPGGKVVSLYRPEGGRFVGDVDLSFEGDRMLFSMPGSNGRWQIFERDVDGSELRELPLIREPDVDNYDACYAPDGAIIFTSSAAFTGVPCVGGEAHVANLYRREPDGRIRRLTVEQDHDWCPTMLADGRVLYLRWEYTDIPHAFSRILFHMNPDGTGQMEYYGSNSYWPASLFYARPVPGHPSMIVAIAGGHHELPRMGDLVLLDPTLGRFEAQGALQRIPGRGRPVAPVMLDLSIAQTWPKFLHPYPLSSKYFLVAAKPAEDAPWGIYLVDVFDNLVCLHEEAGWASFEPIPLRMTRRPPVLPSMVDLGRRDAEVFLVDVHAGRGMKGVPSGTVKSLRIISYHFGYQGMGAEPDSVGLDGPWDPKLVLGTVPVREDGSARFRIPAYTPIAIQPLDREGKAVQLMRSWFTAMPGEVLSCVGCHEEQNTTPPLRKSLAAAGPADEIRPWYGPPRGLDFRREIQPVLDRACLACHDGRPRPDGRSIPNLSDSEPKALQDNASPLNLKAKFSRAYYELRRFVHTPTKESDMHLLSPWAFHADTTRLVQMLQKGHGGVRLDPESWDRLITWIDLNAPAHGTWTDICGESRVRHQAERRQAMMSLTTGVDECPEDLRMRPAESANLPAEGASAPVVSPTLPVIATPQAKPTPLPADLALSRPEASRVARDPETSSIEVPGGLALELVRIPAGEFVMGSAEGDLDEAPRRRVSVPASFWMSRFEITNELYAHFDPAHSSRIEDADYIQFSPGERGWPLSLPRQPVARVSWQRAMDFCRWLSERTGRRFALPTEVQWEYACRAGTETPLSYGALDADFSAYANVSDASHQAIDTFSWAGRAEALPPWRPADARFDDGARVSAPVGSYRPNPWGLHDMHGNVAEWTLSDYRPYDATGHGSAGGGPVGGGPVGGASTSGGPTNMGSGPEAPGLKKVVRGGSWYDRPDRCRSAFRQAYRPEQPVYDVGFRVTYAEE